MRLFALGDLHLGSAVAKPMDVFGPEWREHPRRVEVNWRRRVGPRDWVLVPGDISWAMSLEEALPDLEWLGGLPGRIVLLRGNHDYWWTSVSKVRRHLPPNVRALQNDHLLLGGGVAVAGSRGWLFPGPEPLSEEDERIYRRELARLELSLESARRAGAREIVAMLHFPPGPPDGRPTGFTELLERYPVTRCVYGHLHGPAARNALRGKHRGVEYTLVACDAVGFSPVFIRDLPEEEGGGESGKE